MCYYVLFIKAILFFYVVFFLSGIEICAQDHDTWIETDMDRDGSESGRFVEIGQALWQAGNEVKAEEILINATKMARGRNDIINSTNKLAEFYMATNRNESAINVYSNLLADEDQRKDTLTVVYIYEGLGRAYYADRQYVKSIKCYREAEKLLKLSPDITAQVSLYMNMSRTFVDAGDVKQAFVLIEKAKQLSNPNNIVMMVNILTIEAQVNAMLGEFRTAYFCLDSSVMLNRVVWNREVSTIASSSNTALYRERKEDKDKIRLTTDELEAQVVSGEEMIFKLALALFSVSVLFLLSFGLLVLRHRDFVRANNEKKVLMGANRDSKRVISIVAHDATNQFNTLLGYAEMLMERTKAWSNDESKFINYIYVSAQKLYQSMNNMLVWSKSKSQLVPKPDTVDVKDFLGRVIAISEMAAREKEITINNTVGEDTIAKVDPVHLDIILRNIVANAIKFSNKNSEVNIYAVMHNDRTSIVVEDSGIGMSEEAIISFNNDEKLTSTEGTWHEKGNGIGLIICRDLARKNGGDIIVESQIEKGTSVTVALRKY